MYLIFGREISFGFVVDIVVEKNYIHFGNDLLGFRAPRLIVCYKLLRLQANLLFEVIAKPTTGIQ